MLKILLIEDEVVYATMLSERVRRKCPCPVSMHVISSLSALPENLFQFDLIVSDLHLDDAGPITVRAQFEPISLSIPVLLISSDYDEIDLVKDNPDSRMIAMGKTPLVQEVLVSLIKALSSYREGRGRLAGQASSMAPGHIASELVSEQTT